MSVSQPSREIYVIDVPEIKKFEAFYHYNFFVPDESVNESGGVPVNVLSRPGYEVDSHFVQYSITRVPRFVEFRWTKPRLADVGNVLSERAQRDHAFLTTGEQKGTLILDNIDKIVNEDSFSSNHFSSVQFHDTEIDTKLHELVSGSVLLHTLDEEFDPNVSHYQAAQRLIPLLPDYIKPHWIYKAMTLPGSAYGASFFVTSNQQGDKPKSAPLDRDAASKVMNRFFERLKTVVTNTQVNTKIMHDLVSRAISDPGSSNAGDLVNMHRFSQAAKKAASLKFSPAVSESDYKSFVPFVEVYGHGSSMHSEKYGAEIVGFVIDKLEILSDGTTKAHQPIIVDSPHVNVSADFQVKFNANYCYAIRTIALLKVPAIDDDTGRVVSIKILVSSKPSNKVYVSTLKLRAPPPPGDVNFVWNYSTNKLMVTWAFPTTSERDIKQFQVFKRRSIEHCYELQKVYNFDDSVVTFPLTEDPDPRLVERMVTPLTSWFDDEFDWNVNTSREKGMIYAVCAVDAHAQTSNYSAQYLVWFDRFKNRLQKELVSHAGAPKSYPNLYLEGELLKNTIRVRGPHSKRMKLIFNPEYYYLIDDQNRHTKVVQTRQTGGSYKIQFINIDNLKVANIDVTIDDRTQVSTQKLAYPTVRFGPKRRAPKGDR